MCSLRFLVRSCFEKPKMTSLVDRLRPLQFRGKRRFLGPLAPNAGKKVAKIFGADLELDVSNHVDSTIFIGCYEPVNTFLFKRILRRGGTAVDVGANIGYFTLLAASLVGETGRVIAAEAHPRHFEILAG